MTETVTYKFHEATKPESIVALHFDDKSFAIILPEDTPKPDWTRLEFQKCKNCNLQGDSQFCPAAVGIAHFLSFFSDAISYTKAVVEVETKNRTVVSKVALQYALASLLGLTLATSGCPRTLFLRPMARFHLPFADQRETVFRSLGAWLLCEYVRSGANGNPATLSFEGLKENYAELSTVNATLAERLRAAVTHDAALNAVIILDTFALIAPDNVDSGFEDILDIVTI
jgi:hypothetical protein